MTNDLSMEMLAGHAIRVARQGVLDGTPDSRRYLHRCRHWHAGTRTIVLFTRDQGHHTCGWWRNPDYERCLHLSTSCEDSGKKALLAWAPLLFRGWERFAWIEPPTSDAGKGRDVWHARVFCTPEWQPLIPRGEVYNSEWTEAGWKSWSEVQAQRIDKARQDAEENLESDGTKE